MTEFTEFEDNSYVIDRKHRVWLVVRDGGMATRATYAGAVSIGIHSLESTFGPLVTFDPVALRDRLLAE